MVAPVHHLRRRNVAVLLNGALAGSVPAAGSIIVSANPLRIGGNSIWGEYFNGRIDEVRIYNRALTAAEIVNDMNAAIVP